MGIFTALLKMASMKLRGESIDGNKIMIDNIVFMYKYLHEHYKDAFETKDEYTVFIMSYILRSDIKNGAIEVEDLFDVIRNINTQVRESGETSIYKRSQYNLYLIVYNTMCINHQIIFRKYSKNYLEKAQSKVESLNEYINQKAVQEYLVPAAIETSLQREIITNLEREFGS